ncbi:unnamed protein product [Mytilus edulis]|uniref:Uncharacterized protein n=1 Tax=Mytilus edulis TaxID=6550 RepID=A0A8S3T4Z2_MYTED|nr:unnamed protein product [Mytilus edulis]
MYKIFCFVVCGIFCGLNGYSSANNESKCATAAKNETSRLHCQEHKYIHIEKIWTDEDKCLLGQSAIVLHEIHNMSCRSNSSCDFKHEQNIASKYLSVIYRCADCLPLMSNTTSEIACLTNMAIEIYDVWLTQVHERCPGYKQTHKNHTFNPYVRVKKTFSKKCNKKSRCEISNRDQFRTASVYYHCKGEDGLIDMESETSRQGGVIAAIIFGILIIVGITVVVVCIFRRRTDYYKNKKTDITREKAKYEQSKVPKEHRNENKNSGVQNSPYEIASSIGYSYDMASTELDSIAGQYEVPKEHRNGGKINAIVNSPYEETASSIEYSFDMTNAEPDSNGEQYEVPKEHSNRGKNNAILNSPYEMASSKEYAYSLTSAEPDSICVKNTGGSNEHLYVKGNRTTEKLSFDIENPIGSTYSHLRDADGGSDMTYDHTSHVRVQRTPESDYDVSCNRITEDEYTISENFNVLFHKDSDYNEI